MAVFLDNNSTTPVDPEVTQTLTESCTQFCGNPSSSHVEGQHAQGTLNDASVRVSRLLHCESQEIYWTSGATQANNIVLLGFVNASKKKTVHIVTTQIEHASILNPLRHLNRTQSRRVKVHEVPVDRKGRVNLDVYREIIERFPVDLVSIIHVNHEVGITQDLRTLSDMAHSRGAWFHSDMTQSMGKIAISMKALGVDAASASSHKFYGLKGCGVLFLSDRMRPHVSQIEFGGDQQRQLIPGTENVHGALATAIALEVCERKRRKDLRNLKKLTKYLLMRLDHTGHPVRINGQGNALNLSFLDVTGWSSHEFVKALSERGVCVSKGAACKSRSDKESYILDAMGLEQISPNIRIGIGRFNTTSDIDKFIEAVDRLLR